METQSHNTNITRRKVLSMICLVVLLLAFIFACMQKFLPLGRIIVGTFGIITYPLLLVLSLISLASFLGFSYTRRKKPTAYFLIALFSVLFTIQSISTFKQLNLVLNFKTLGKYLAYSYTTKVTLVGSVGSILCGLFSIMLGAMGTIVIYVILATLFIGLFVDYQYYGKFEEPHVKKLKTRVLREKVQNSDKKRTKDNQPIYPGINDDTAYVGVAGEMTVDVDEISNEGTIYDYPSYEQDDVVAETTEDIYDYSQSLKTSYDTPKSIDSEVYEAEKYQSVFTGKSNEDRERFMDQTFGRYTTNVETPYEEESSIMNSTPTYQDDEDEMNSTLYGSLDEGENPYGIDEKISKILNTSEDEVQEGEEFKFGESTSVANTGFETDYKHVFGETPTETTLDPVEPQSVPDYSSIDYSSIMKRNGGFNLTGETAPIYPSEPSISQSTHIISAKPKQPRGVPTGMPGIRYNEPPLSLLRAPKPDTGDYSEEQNRKSAQLERVLDAFNISAKVKNIVRGPKITRFELAVPLGVSLKKIPGYEKDIAAALAARTITIQAPIPGSPYVGIELENETYTSVYERELFESDAFQNAKDPLPIAIGKDISGEIVVKSLAKMVHLLIAGSTGSGKSVFIHNIVLSLIYKNSPDDLRLVMIDPKKVEFGRYNGLPHLLTPEVVMGADKAVNALKWCVGEMDRRYGLMQKAGYNNIEPYNKSELVKAGQFEKFPYIVIIVDELAEVMMANKKESEAYIQRITQLARACGMHLILATQRPSVDIITGVIKNNSPSRIAFSLQSGIDSKTILNTVGAEKLLGQGDMIFSPTGTSAMPRLQAAYASDEEIHSVIDYCKQYNTTDYDESVLNAINEEQTEYVGEKTLDMPPPKDDDPYFKTAVKQVMMNNGASTSYLQRRLQIGYSRAARIIDTMEDRGFIAPASGSKLRKVLITPEQFLEEFGEEFDSI